MVKSNLLSLLNHNYHLLFCTRGWENENSWPRSLLLERMVQMLQQLVNGLILGSVYALLALGYTMVYGIIKLINFAHGDIYMVGAFMGYFLLNSWKVNFFVALLPSHGWDSYFRGCN